MTQYRFIDIAIDRTQIFRNFMAEYALISASKIDEEEIPMQYARCDLQGIFEELFAEEIGYLCSQMLGYVSNCTEDGSIFRLSLNISSNLDTSTDSIIRKRIESYLTAATLSKCLMPINSISIECAAIEKRAKLALRALRHILAVN